MVVVVRCEDERVDDRTTTSSRSPTTSTMPMATKMTLFGSRWAQLLVPTVTVV